MSNGRGPADMKIQLRLDGLRTVTRGFAQLRDAGQRSARALRDGARTVGRDLQRVATVSKIAAKGVATVGGAALAVGAGGVALLNKSLQDTAALSREVAEEIDALQKKANAFNIQDGRTVGGLQFAAANEGASDGALDRALTQLADFAEAAINGEETAIRAFASVGATWEDLVDELGNTRRTDDILLNISDRFSALPESANRTAVAIELLGKRAGPELVTFLNRGRGALQAYIADYNELRGIEDGDVDLVGAFKGQQDRRLAAFDGLRTAVARGFLPALQQVDRELELFFVEQRGAAEQFGLVAGGFVTELVPKLLEAGRVLAALLSGQAAQLEDTPLKRVFETGLAAIQGFTQGVLDLVDLLSTGDLAAAPPWLQATVQFAQDAAGAISGLIQWGREMGELWAGTLSPAFEQLVSAVQSVYELLGVDEPASQLAITAALVAFGGTITAIITKLGALVLALGKAGAAAAGLGAAGAGAAGAAGIAGAAATGALAAAATGAAVVGSGVAVGAAAVSAQDFRRQVDEATRIAQELAKTEGEAYAAAYLTTFLETVPQEFKGFTAANGALSFLTGGRAGVDLESIKANLSLVINEGDIQESAAGVRRALADLGLNEAGEPINGQVGYDLNSRLTVQEVQLSPDARAQLQSLADVRGIARPGETSGVGRFATGGRVRGPGTGTSDSILARLSHGEFVVRAAAVRRYGADFLDRINNLRLPGFATGGLVSPAAVPSPVILSQSAGTPVNLTLPGIGEFAMRTDAGTADELLRAVRKTKRARL